ncbi:hypothetical protein QFC22_003345 [Naganishia vaughanmartiniae]|uniref:Uncharacterized protein n=1 Tax=Naganishia vaughanmartiniae TaxID=1424756 RepID=A0ACC2X991_9TREE|nr:hypothetical protein QFC22_003345 [Naganishia vaughanmartiniae]
MSEHINTQPPIPAEQAPPAAAVLDKLTADDVSSSATATSGGATSGLAGGLSKWMHQAETYMNKAVETARPYAEAVQHKTEGLVQQTREGAVGKGEGDAGLVGKVQATFTQVTSVIDQRTATDKHPGLVTMLAQATTSMIEKVDRAMDASVENPASTSAAAAAVAPFASPRASVSGPSTASTSGPSTASTSEPSAPSLPEPALSGPNTASTSSAPQTEGEKPVTTTTNTVIHSDSA